MEIEATAFADSEPVGEADRGPRAPADEGRGSAAVLLKIEEGGEGLSKRCFDSLVLL